MRQLQPPAIRILDPDVQQISDAYKVCPNALLLPRDHSLSEQKSDANRDPVGTGKRHAIEWRDKIDYWRNQAQAREMPFPHDDQIVIVGINEPNEGVGVNAQTAYTMALCREARGLGLSVSALNLGVGWPANTGPDTPPDWSPYAEMLRVVEDGGHYLTLHSYWYDDPTTGWGWLAGRHRHVPQTYGGRIIIGECGVDRYVDAERWRNEGGNRGWRGNWEPEEYAADIAWYADNCDTRVVAVLPFLTDYRSREWESFDTAPAHPWLVMMAQSAATAPPAEHTVHIPVVTVGEPEQPQPEPQEQAMSVLDPAVMMAILDVESGAAFGDGGRLVIRFEAHIFRDRLRNKFHDQLRSDVLFSAHFQIADSQPWAAPQYARESESSPWWAIHTGSQADEWRAFELAGRIDYRAAVESISMGRPQIMGGNHARVGYPTAEAMFAAFADRNSGEAAQIIAFLAYLLSDPELVRAVRERDWATIARLYNGPGSVPTYSVLLEKAYQKRVAK
jgi:hypothetical protein